jgi:hypothetical protein
VSPPCCLVAAHCGHLTVVKYLLVAGASIAEAGRQGHMLWHTLNLVGADHAELTSLLQAMVLLGDAPRKFIAGLSTQDTELCFRGKQLRAQLPTYTEEQEASIVAHCPLPSVLQPIVRPIVAAYAAPTADDVWTYGLRTWLVECSNPTCNGAGLLRCTACQQTRYCGQQCQRAHWTAHKVDCKRQRAELKAKQGASMQDAQR